MARARDLSNRKALSLETVKRILNFLSRHLKDKQGATWEQKGKGWQAWHMWGGNPGGRWAASIIRRHDPDWYARWLDGPRNRALLRHLGVSTRRPRG